MLPNYYKWTRMEFGQRIKGRVVEIGAGAGHFLDHYIESVDHVVAIDYNKELVERIKRRFSDKNINGVVADLRDEKSLEVVDEADTIIALDILEHFEDHQMIVRNIVRILKKGGYFLVKVPAQSALFGNADYASGHFRRYDPDKLVEIMENCGLSTVSLRYINRLGAIAYRFKRGKKTNFSKTFNPAILKVINSVIPLLAIVDKVIPGKGLSLIGVFRKV